jgi:hypothetical protein
MVLLNRSYGGYPAGTVAEFPASTEAALIAQGIAVTSAAVATAGAQSTTLMAGSGSCAIGAASVVITNPNVDVTSKCFAVVAQAAADATALRVERVVPAAGSFTVHFTANATAATEFTWMVVNSLLQPLN